MADVAGGLDAVLGWFWHPVCTEAELAARPGGVIGVRLLGQDLAVAALGDGRLACLPDRCLHRSTRLSVGWVEGATLRCAYHGWRWGADGRCTEIPSLPDGPIPPQAWHPAFQVEAAHGLVWVRLRPGAATTIPACPALEDPTMHVVAGEPYTWPVAAARRVENFTDLSHFAWVHDGSLGRRDEPVPPVPEIRREAGELRFSYLPPLLDDQAPAAMTGASSYRMPMPFTVEIAFDLPGKPGARRHLWMTASPVDAVSCRTFWIIARNDALDEPDAAHLAFQDLVLAEDRPVVWNQVPPQLPLVPGAEISVRTDRVSVEYRRWLAEVASCADAGSAGIDRALGLRSVAGLTRSV